MLAEACPKASGAPESNEAARVVSAVVRFAAWQPDWPELDAQADS